MKNPFKFKKNKNKKQNTIAHLCYHISDDCMNEDAYITCYKCGKCGRKFTKTGLLKNKKL